MQVYIDLFDDEIYDPSRIYSKNGHFDYEADVIRLHIFLWLVFGQQIVVPEQWAVSSASFQVVVAEIVKSYTEFKKRNPDHATPPVIIRTIKRNLDSEMSLCEAFHSRLSMGKRIMLGPEFDLQSEVARKLRQELAGQFEVEMEKSSPFQKGFIGSIQDIYANNNLSEEHALKVSESLAHILKYDWELRKSQINQRFYLDDARYAQSLQREVFAVQETAQAVMEEGVSNNLLGGLSEFFERVQKKGLEKFQIIDMWAETKDFDTSQQRFIERLGRICMHQALRDQCSAKVGTLATSKPMIGRLSDFENDFQDAIRSNVAQKAGVPSDLLLPTFATSKTQPDGKEAGLSPAAGYDLLPHIPWGLVWERLWDFQTDPVFSKQRQKLNEDLKKIGVSEKLHESDAWDEFFDVVTKRVVNIRLGRDEKEKTCFNVKGAVKKSGKDAVDVAFNAPGAISGSPTAIIGLIMSLGSILHAPARKLYNHYMQDQFRPEMIRSGLWCVDHIEGMGWK